LRIVAGKYRGLHLVTLKGRRVRPTADRVREAIFSILGIDLSGLWVLDLFAGTGAMARVIDLERIFASERRYAGPSFACRFRMIDNTAAIGVNKDNAQLMVGPTLEFDPEREKFVNNPAADQLLTRPPREPFVVPEKV